MVSTNRSAALNELAPVYQDDTVLLKVFAPVWSSSVDIRMILREEEDFTPYNCYTWAMPAGYTWLNIGIEWFNETGTHNMLSRVICVIGVCRTHACYRVLSMCYQV